MSTAVKLLAGRDVITAVLPGRKTLQLKRTHPKAEEFITAAKESNVDRLLELADFNHVLQALSGARLRYSNGALYFGEQVEPLHGSIFNRIIQLLDSGDNFAPLVNLVIRTLGNTSAESIEDLYRFMQDQKLGITPNGFILGYKGVRDDYFDSHSNTYLNIPGARIRMSRKEVDPNRRAECSTGFHIGSYAYASGFGNRRVLVLLDPIDAVAVPHDCAYQKMRAEGYIVLRDQPSALQGMVHDIPVPPAPKAYGSYVLPPVQTPQTRVQKDPEAAQKILSGPVSERFYADAEKDTSVVKPVAKASKKETDAKDTAKEPAAKAEKPQKPKKTPADVNAKTKALVAEVTESRLFAYIDEKIKAGEKPTLKQVQSRLKTNSLTCAQLGKVILRAGYALKGYAAGWSKATVGKLPPKEREIRAKVVAYLRHQFDEGNTPTIKQVQSRLKSLNSSQIAKMLTEMGYTVIGDGSKAAIKR